jgi:hypothetical protein
MNPLDATRMIAELRAQGMIPDGVDAAARWLGVKGSTASVADGGTITHGLGTTPTWVMVTGTVASQIVSVTAIGATTFTVAIKTDAGGAGSSQTIHWEVA